MPSQIRYSLSENSRESWLPVTGCDGYDGDVWAVYKAVSPRGDTRVCGAHIDGVHCEKIITDVVVITKLQNIVEKKKN